MENAPSFHYCIRPHFLFLHAPRRQNIWKNIYEIHNPIILLWYFSPQQCQEGAQEHLDRNAMGQWLLETRSHSGES